MRSFRHLPELKLLSPTPGRISAMLRYGFSFCLCLPDTLYRFNWSSFLHGKKNTPSDSRPRQVHLILALISAIGTATHLKRSWVAVSADQECTKGEARLRKYLISEEYTHAPSSLFKSFPNHHLSISNFPSLDMFQFFW